MKNRPTAPGARRQAIKTIAALGIAALAVPIGASAASAALVAPTAPHNIIVVPSGEIVMVEGYRIGTKLTVEVVRGGVVIGHAQGTSVQGPEGPLLEINHEPDVCWIDWTPDIRPGDEIRVTADGATDTQFIRTQDVFASDPKPVDTDADGANDAVAITGWARSATGTPINVSNIEIGLRNKAFKGSPVGSSQDIFAPSAGAAYDGTFAYDAISADNPDGANYTAIFSFGRLSDSAETNALKAAEEGAASITTWMAGDAEAPREATTFEAGAPEALCPVPMAKNDITGASSSVLNQGTYAGGDALTFSGVAYDATEVSVNLTDADGNPVLSAPATLNGATGSQSWSASFTAAQHAQLADGMLTATMIKDGATSSTMKVRKDTVAPAAPSASFTDFSGGFDLMLSRGEASDRVFYTIGDMGSTVANPSNASTEFTSASPPRRWNGAGTVKAIAYDTAGNSTAMTPVDHFVSTRPSAPALTAAVAGNGTANLTWTAPANNGGSEITGYRVRAVSPTGQVTSVDFEGATLTSAPIAGLMNGTAYSFDIEARTVAFDMGNARSNSMSVTPFTKPGTPVLGKVQQGDRTATVSWMPGVNGGKAITSYSVRMYSGTTVTEVTLPASARSFQATKLTPGAAYSFRVAARNADGASGLSAWSAATPKVVIASPATLSKVVSGAAGGALTATVSWQAPKAVGADTVTGYRVVAVSTAGKTVVSRSLKSTTTSFAFPLPTGSYKFQVVTEYKLSGSVFSRQSSTAVAAK